MAQMVHMHVGETPTQHKALGLWQGHLGSRPPTPLLRPAGCTDVDDTLHARALAGGCFEIGVHIADVSHFVRQARGRARRPARRSSAALLGRLALLQELASIYETGKRGCFALNVTTSILGQDARATCARSCRFGSTSCIHHCACESSSSCQLCMCLDCSCHERVRCGAAGARDCAGGRCCKGLITHPPSPSPASRTSAPMQAAYCSAAEA